MKKQKEDLDPFVLQLTFSTRENERIFIQGDNDLHSVFLIVSLVDTIIEYGPCCPQLCMDDLYFLS